jgi:hypothetical protein
MHFIITTANTSTTTTTIITHNFISAAHPNSGIVELLEQRKALW